MSNLDNEIQEPSEDIIEEENCHNEQDISIEEPDEISILEDRICELTNENLKVRAEYDNFRKRSQKEKESIGIFSTVTTLDKILPVLDNFERALKIDSTDTAFKDGMVLIYNQLKEILDGFGVKEIVAEGKIFNPDYHNAVMRVESTLPENTIVEVLQKGYSCGDHILRHPMVSVSGGD